MKIKATTPCYKFIDAKPRAQIEKIKEELAEVEEAYELYRKCCTDEQYVALLMEIIDVQACCKTFIAQLESHCYHGRKPLKTAKKAVLAKNMARGYYTKPE